MVFVFCEFEVLSGGSVLFVFFEFEEFIRGSILSPPPPEATEVLVFVLFELEEFADCGCGSPIEYDIGFTFFAGEFIGLMLFEL